jgi:hypothetical protein
VLDHDQAVDVRRADRSCAQTAAEKCGKNSHCHHFSIVSLWNLFNL